MDTKASASTPKPTGPAPQPSPRPSPRYYRPSVWKAYQQLLQRSRLPILVGPWKSEIGFEVLYWLPFLQHLRDALQIDPARLIPITRGGAAAWYGVPTGVELYGMRTPQQVRVELRIQHAKTGFLKQLQNTAFDRQIVRDAAATLGLTRYLTIHPAWMYHLVAPFWEGQTGLDWLRHAITFGPAIAPAIPDTLTLPKQFVAARFYGRPTLPPSPTIHQFAVETIKQVSTQVPVILLNSGLFLDDHMDFAMPPLPNVQRLSDLVPLTPENNLALQSAVLARSSGFVGTYGGLAQVALRYQRPVVSFFHEWVGTCLAHRHLSEALALQQGTPFHVQKLGDIPLLQSVLPKVVVQNPQHVGTSQLQAV